MLKRLGVIVFITVFSVISTGCIGPYIDMYKNIRKAREAEFKRQQQETAALKEQEEKIKAQNLAMTLRGERALDRTSVIKLLPGQYIGSTCNGRADVEITITTAFTLNELGGFSRLPGTLVYVYGKLRATDPHGHKIKTYVRGTLNLFGGILSLHADKQPTVKEFIEFVSRHEGRSPQQSKELFNQFKTNTNNTLDQFEKNFGSRELEDDGITPLVTFTLNMSLARDSAGQGWAGEFNADGFDGCDEIAIKNDNGDGTKIFPPVTQHLAIRFAHENNNFYSRVYWLKTAERFGDLDPDTILYFAQAYEELGKKSPHYYTQALQYYLRGAKQLSDMRAQKALARLYRGGLGTPVNIAEAKKWQALADKTNKAATEICASRKTVAAMYSLVRYGEQQAKVMEMFGALLTGVNVDPGSARLLRISPQHVISLHRQFLCQALGKYVDPHADASGVPDFVYAGTDENGVDYAYDNRLDKLAKTGIASLTESLAKMAVLQYNFVMDPQGGKKYLITYYIGSTPNSLMLDLR